MFDPLWIGVTSVQCGACLIHCGLVLCLCAVWCAVQWCVFDPLWIGVMSVQCGVCLIHCGSVLCQCSVVCVCSVEDGCYCCNIHFWPHQFTVLKWFERACVCVYTLAQHGMN